MKAYDFVKMWQKSQFDRAQMIHWILFWLNEHQQSEKNEKKNKKKYVAQNIWMDVILK